MVPWGSSFREEVDVVCDYHEVSDLEFRVHASRGVRHEEGLDAQFIHHSDRECNLLHVVSLIIVEASFHRHDVYASELAENEFSGMALHCRYREVGDFRIGKLIAVSYF